MILQDAWRKEGIPADSINGPGSGYTIPLCPRECCHGHVAVTASGVSCTSGHELTESDVAALLRDFRVLTVTNTRFDLLRDEAKRMLAIAQRKAPRLFCRGAVPMRLTVTEDDTTATQTLSATMMADELTTAITWRYTRTDRKGNITETVGDVPRVIGERLTKQVEPFLPPLRGVVEHPALRPDGTVITTPGYDEQSGIYYTGKVRTPTLPAEPETDEQRREQAREAMRWLGEELYCDMPWGTDADRANALAFTLTPLIRHYVDVAPAWCADGTSPGSGKTRVINVVSLIYRGCTMEATLLPETEEETRKQITTWLEDGETLICLDEAEDVRWRSLRLAISEARWKQRRLGVNEAIRAPQVATWALMANNMRLDKHMIRRTYATRFDTDHAVPWTRTGWRHPDLLAWVEANRGELLAALLTAARAWYAAGQPAPTVPPIGGFEQWTRVVGGILEYAGVEGFLGNLQDTYGDGGEDRSEWTDFAHLVYEKAIAHDGRLHHFTVRDLAGAISEDKRLQETLPTDLAVKWETGKSIGKTLSHALREHNGTVLGVEHGYRFDTLKDRSAENTTIYRLTRHA